MAYIVSHKIAFGRVTIKYGLLAMQVQDNNSHIFSSTRQNADLLVHDGNHAALQPGLVESDEVGRHRIASTLHRGRDVLDVRGDHGMFILDVSVEVELGGCHVPAYGARKGARLMPSTLAGLHVGPLPLY